jgi:hypothetical protein
MKPTHPTPRIAACSGSVRVGTGMPAGVLAAASRRRHTGASVATANRRFAPH